MPDIVIRARWQPAEGFKGLGFMNVFRKNWHVNLALLFDRSAASRSTN